MISAVFFTYLYYVVVFTVVIVFLPAVIVELVHSFTGKAGVKNKYLGGRRDHELTRKQRRGTMETVSESLTENINNSITHEGENA